MPSIKHAAGIWLMAMFALHCHDQEQKQQSITAQALCSTLQIGPVLWCSAAYQYECSTNQEMLSSIHNIVFWLTGLIKQLYVGPNSAND